MAQELLTAELKIIKEAQASAFAMEYKALMKKKPISSGGKLLNIKPKLERRESCIQKDE